MKQNKVLFILLLTSYFLLLSSPKAFADFTLNAGTAAFNNYAQFRTSTITINSTLTCSQADLFVSGNWNNSGVFNAGSSTITFESNLATSTIVGNTTFYCFVCQIQGKTIQFTQGTTQYGTSVFTINGSAGNLIRLRSTIAGSKWGITFPNSSQKVNYVDVKDSNANLNTVNCSNSLDSGNNNANWNFDTIAPAGISNLTALKGAADGQIVLSWTSPGDDGAVDNLLAGSQFQIKYSTVAIITNANYGNASHYVINISTSGVNPATTCSYVVANLSAGVTYWFAIKTRDDANNWSVWNSSADVLTVNTSAYIYIPFVVKSAGTGNWSTTGTWEGNAVPWTNQGVQIQSGHTVTYNKNDANVACSTLTLSGTLQFDGAVDTRTMVVAGNVDVLNGGKLLLPPNTGYISTLKIKCDTDGQYGIIVNNGGVFDVQGNTTTTPSTRNCLLASDNPSAKTYIQNLSQTEANFNMYYVQVSSVGEATSGKYGITFDGAGTRGKINYCSIHNNMTGIRLISSSSNTISNNSCYSNTDDGIYLNGSSNNTISNNSCYSNSSVGILLYNSSNNILSNNNCYSNTKPGIQLQSSSNNTISNNSCYSNTNYGIYTNNSINNTVANCELGKGGNNTSGDIGYEAGYVSKLILKNCNLYSTTKVNTTGINTAGSYLVSYNQDNFTGTVKLWGDYNIPSGSTGTFNYAQPLYVSTATKPNSTLKGTGSISYPVTVDSMTVTELWEVKCTGDPNFEVRRGTWSVMTLDGTASEGSAYTSTSRGVQFTINTDAYSVGDAFYFVTISSSPDKNVQKKLEFNDSPIGTRMFVDAGGTVQMIGTPANPTISTSAVVNIYYGFQSSGTLNLSNYVLSNLKSNGLEIYPNATVVDLSSGTFNTIQDSADSSYIRVSGLTSAATFYGCVFNDTPGTADFNVKADGSGIKWTFRNWSGVKAGENYDYELNSAVINWPDTLSVDIVEVSFNFGNVPFGGSAISVSSATIINNGDNNATYQIKLSTPAGWTAGTAAGVDQFVFYVLVSSVTPKVSDFNTEDIVLTTAQNSTATVFAGPGTENGVNIPPAAKRYLWARFLAPTQTSVETQQGITVTITPVSP